MQPQLYNHICPQKDAWESINGCWEGLKVFRNRRRLSPLRMCVCGWVGAYAKLLQSSFPTLCNPMDCSPSGPTVHGILQARKPEWVAMPTSRGSS